MKHRLHFARLLRAGGCIDRLQFGWSRNCTFRRKMGYLGRICAGSLRGLRHRNTTGGRPCKRPFKRPFKRLSADGAGRKADVDGSGVVIMSISLEKISDALLCELA